MRIHPPYKGYKAFRELRPLDSPEYAIDLSILAYAEPNYARDVCCLANLTSIPITVGSFHCLIVKGRPSEPCVLSFRGTVGFENWWTDFRFEKNSDGFHSGFEGATEALLPEIKPFLSKEIIFTGHSLGAAMAVIAANKLRNDFTIKKVINFGQPRIGSVSAINKLESIKWIRYIHGKDIVTTVPPSEFGFVHETDIVKPEVIVLDQVTRSIFGGFSVERPFYIPIPIWDHVPTLYAERIWNAST